MALKRGWKYDATNTRLSVYVNGTEAGRFDNATPYITSLAGLTVTTSNCTVTAGDTRNTVGNCRLGAVEAFSTTEPTSAMVFMVGTAPVGTITTSGALYTDGTNVMKIIANGTADNVET